MKKKKIEAFPYLGFEKGAEDKQAVYIARTTIFVTGEEKYLILEIYVNEERDTGIPLMRYVANDREWGIFEPATGKWSRKSIRSGSSMYWYEIMPELNIMLGQTATCLYEKDDLKNIESFFNKSGIKRAWWEYLERNEEKIRNREREKRYKKRGERLNERIKYTPRLDKNKMRDYADKNVFYNKHYLFYKKTGCRVNICCSKCGKTYRVRYKPGISHESLFERCITEPKEGEIAVCELCKAGGVYKPQGRAARDNVKWGKMYRIDKYREKGIVCRYMETEKKWILEESPGENGKLQMQKAYEQVEVWETARTYFEPGKKSHTDFCKINQWGGKDYWDDCNYSGNYSYRIGEGPVHPDSWANLRDTEFSYCVLEEYAGSQMDMVNVKEYLECYRRVPQVEMLVKAGMTETVRTITRGTFEPKDGKACRMDAFLGIRKERIAIARKYKGKTGLIRILQVEKELGQNWTVEQIVKLEQLEMEEDRLRRCLTVMSVQKLLNAIEKYAGCHIDGKCGRSRSHLRHTAITYADYLGMRMDLGYDMSNTVYLRPRDLEEAHAKMVLEQNGVEMDRKIKEKEKEYPDIRNSYRKLRKRYFYEDEEYQVRPAKSAGEIITEGRVLHHCVGGDGYLSGHNKGKSYILMLRKKGKEEIPYITMEIRGKRIVQWYGAYDKKPDEEKMESWIKGYVRHLEEKQA